MKVKEELGDNVIIRVVFGDI